MKRLKIIVIRLFLDRGLAFRLVLLFISSGLAVLESFYPLLDYPRLDDIWLGLLFLISLVIYAILFLFYGLMRHLFKRVAELPEAIRHFDERLLFGVLGFYGLFPLGLVMEMMNTLHPGTLADGSGLLVLLQGLAIGFAAMLSRLLKK